MADAGNTDGYLQTGEWMLGVDVTLDDSFDQANDRVRIRDNVEIRTEQGQAYVHTRNWRWSFDFNFTNATDTTRNQIRALDLAVEGNGVPFAFVYDDTDPAEAYYVRMVGSNLSERKVHYNRHSISLNLIEETPGTEAPK